MTLYALIKRNTKVYFKDKAVFFTSLITPLILLCLFVTFLKNVYIDSVKAFIPADITVSKSLLEGFAGSWLISSLLAVSCVTVAFCANMVMVQDKATGGYNDLTIAPIKKSTLSLSYYISTAIVTFIVCFTAFAIGLVYLAIVGFYMSFADVLLAIIDIIILVLFGTALSSIVCRFLKTQGAMSAVATLVSSVYGFICGAYMPMSQFGETLQKILMCCPWTYGTGLIRNHMMAGSLKQLKKAGVNENILSELSKSFDAKLTFFNHDVSVLAMYLVIILTTVALIGIFLLLNYIKKRKKSN